eukprot:scaffold10220_cov144-Isochrysis_galbana.AAC.4
MNATAAAIAGSEPGTGNATSPCVEVRAMAKSERVTSSPRSQTRRRAISGISGAEAEQSRMDASYSTAPAVSCQKRDADITKESAPAKPSESKGNATQGPHCTAVAAARPPYARRTHMGNKK